MFSINRRQLLKLLGVASAAAAAGTIGSESAYTAGPSAPAGWPPPSSPTPVGSSPTATPSSAPRAAPSPSSPLAPSARPPAVASTAAPSPRPAAGPPWTTPDGPYAVAEQGQNNLAGGSYATVSGGQNNTANGDYGVVGGGYSNSTVGSPTQSFATVGGGWGNTASGFVATIGGGYNNTASGQQATIGGGGSNTANQTNATVAGGGGNTASNSYGTVGGGFTNTASGYGATVPGGFLSAAAGTTSFAAGRQAKANHNGAFVWGDATAADVASTAINQFIARASGGVTFYSNSLATTGVNLAAGSGSWSMLSDRAAKTGFKSLDLGDLLERLMSIPVQSWSYRSQDPSVRHIGPTAQDFSAAFGVGEEERHITTVDGIGVALAAIQALRLEVLDLRGRLAAVEGA